MTADYAPYLMGDTLPGVQVGTAGVTAGLLVNVSGVTASAGDTVLGVAQSDAAAGAFVTVHRGGIQYLWVPTGTLNGTPLKAGAGGTVVPWVSGTDAANLYIADAVEAAPTGTGVRRVKALWR